ncbi:putative dead box ATP-dependent RNA helicase [Corchorus olitorius]|uniref:Dead box ATP-dependent RNA helicase n=1 Tax=Corchorus olitorius TaxID=93759 RepID=A0A1R3FX48_9ROSI|nr:putative dead box ATP-dependent RNA helicase [Corchorus olitorius]
MEGVCVVWLLWWRDCAVCEAQGEADSVIVCVGNLPEKNGNGTKLGIRMRSWPTFSLNKRIFSLVLRFAKVEEESRLKMGSLPTGATNSNLY